MLEAECCYVVDFSACEKPIKTQRELITQAQKDNIRLFSTLQVWLSKQDHKEKDTVKPGDSVND